MKELFDTAEALLIQFRQLLFKTDELRTKIRHNVTELKLSDEEMKVIRQLLAERENFNLLAESLLEILVDDNVRGISAEKKIACSMMLRASMEENIFGHQ
jgi:hypothetical protein